MFFWSIHIILFQLWVWVVLHCDARRRTQPSSPLLVPCSCIYCILSSSILYYPHHRPNDALRAPASRADQITGFSPSRTPAAPPLSRCAFLSNFPPSSRVTSGSAPPLGPACQISCPHLLPLVLTSQVCPSDEVIFTALSPFIPVHSRSGPERRRREAEMS